MTQDQIVTALLAAARSAVAATLGERAEVVWPLVEPEAGQAAEEAARELLALLAVPTKAVRPVAEASRFQNLRELIDAYGGEARKRLREGTITYDRIVMNPPFERGQDMVHVRRAYEANLAPGGRLVAITSEGPFFRSDKQATEFRAWLESVGGQSERLPAGSFRGSDASTDVATRLVVIDKP
jgi:hypothetical protein